MISYKIPIDFDAFNSEGGKKGGGGAFTMFYVPRAEGKTVRLRTL